MRILAIDGEQSSLDSLVEAIRAAQPQAEIFASAQPEQLLEFAKKYVCDVAFLDIEIHGSSGLYLAKRLREIRPATNIVFVTAYPDYMGEAFAMHVSGYILKPPTKDSIQWELDNLRHPLSPGHRHIRVATFGAFELFVDEKPVAFAKKKAKELFAYLVDRKGLPVTEREIAAILWEDHLYSKWKQFQLQRVYKSMIKTLEKSGAETLVQKEENLLSIKVQNLQCDYYDYLMIKPYALKAYQGKYMPEYSWAECTQGLLNMTWNRQRPNAILL